MSELRELGRRALHELGDGARGARRAFDGGARRPQRLLPRVRERRALVEHVREVVALGTPHLGAPLAQGVHHLAHHLHRLPETRPVARFLRRRSDGIRDLHHGSLVDADWESRDPDELRAAAIAEVPLLEGVTNHFALLTTRASTRSCGGGSPDGPHAWRGRAGRGARGAQAAPATVWR